MTRIGEGVAPNPPPGAPGRPPIAGLREEWNFLYEGRGTEAGSLVSFTVYEDPFKAVVRISIQVNRKYLDNDIYIPTSLVDKTGDNPCEWLVSPPFRVAGAPSRECWLALDMTSEHWERAGKLTPDGKRLAKLAVKLQLGNQAFGLIHIVCRHKNALRALAGPSNSNDREFDSHRMFQMIQNGVETCCNIRSLDEILISNATSDRKLVLMGGGQVIVATWLPFKRCFCMTTLYTNDQRRPQGETGWKRSAVRR